MEEKINNFKKEYKKIKFVKSPAFLNEKIYFDYDGLRHLIWKGRVRRENREINERILLFKKVPKAISTLDRHIEYREVKDRNSDKIINFWKLNIIKDNENIYIIIRKIGNGKKKFFSVFNSKLT